MNDERFSTATARARFAAICSSTTLGEAMDLYAYRYGDLLTPEETNDARAPEYWLDGDTP